MTDKEYRRAKMAGGAWPSQSGRAVRKSKLKMRFKGPRLDAELARTSEKLWLLCELLCERRNRR
jgi:hypothetical protein